MTTDTDTDIVDVAGRARELAGHPVTIYTRDQDWGVVVTSGHLGHVTENVYLTMARDRTARGLPPEVVRVMLPNVIGLHPEGDQGVPAHRIRPGHVLSAGPLAGAQVTSVVLPEEFGAGVVRLTVLPPTGEQQVVWAETGTRLT